jgi:hypothetical protein
VGAKGRHGYGEGACLPTRHGPSLKIRLLARVAARGGAAAATRCCRGLHVIVTALIAVLHLVDVCLALRPAAVVISARTVVVVAAPVAVCGPLLALLVCREVSGVAPVACVVPHPTAVALLAWLGAALIAAGGPHSVLPRRALIGAMDVAGIHPQRQPHLFA